MPTATASPGVLSLQSALVVADGNLGALNYVDMVKIFKPDTSQWYKTDPLPTACQEVSLVVIGNTWYALGGYILPLNFNQALYPSLVA